MNLNLDIEFELEDDGRWIAEVINLPGVLAYGDTKEEALTKVKSLALRVLADRLECNEAPVDMLNLSFVAV